MLERLGSRRLADRIVSLRPHRLVACVTICAGLAAPGVFAQTSPAPASGAAAPPSLGELAAQFEKSSATVVAEVDGTPITLGMVADRLHDFPEKFGALPASLIYKGAVDDLIMQRTLAVKAKELGLDKLPETQRRIAEATDRTLGQALMHKIVPELVTDAAVEGAYKATVAGKPGPEQVRFRVIATATESEANDILVSLAKGSDFSALARQFSKDPSGLTGGEIDYVGRERLGPEIGAVVFALSPGQTTAFPVRANGLWFIFRVEGRRQQGTPTLAEAKTDLTNGMIREASAEILRKSRAAVVVKEYGPTGLEGHEDLGPLKTH